MFFKRTHVLFLYLMVIYASPSIASQEFCSPPQENMMPIAQRPVHDIHEYGAKGDGITDDTVALQNAFDKIAPGSVLRFPEGTFLHKRSLILRKDDVVLVGTGGELRATNPDDQSLIITGSRSAVVDMKITGTGNVRSTQPNTTGIWLKGSRLNQIINSNIHGFSSAGIFIYGAQDFRIIGNTVSRTLADGIHMTHGANSGLIKNNIVEGTGDDMIAVVSYGNELRDHKVGTSHDIIISRNKLSANTWGRGIAVVGGQKVLIENNIISDVWKAAGILVAQEGSYNTGDVDHVLILNNIIKRVQVANEPGGKHYARHGAIDLNTSTKGSVRSVVIQGNHIDDAGFSGIRIANNSCQVIVDQNSISRSGQKALTSPISVSIPRDSCVPLELSCSRNTNDGSAYNPATTNCAPQFLDDLYLNILKNAPKITNAWKDCQS